MVTQSALKRKSWQIQEAKARLSEVVKEAERIPQIITIRGKDTAVLLSINEFEKLNGPKQTLYEFIQSSPLKDLNLELPERTYEEMRTVGL